jgi:hypothetical protein
VSAARFTVADTGEAFAVVDCASGAVVAYATELGAFALARLLNVLEPVPEQLDSLLGEGRGKQLLRTIELRHPGVCRRCGRPMQAGSRARWNASTRLIQHVRRCRAAAAANRASAAA